MPKSSCLKWTYGRPGTDYRVASLFTRYLTAIEIIPESLNLIGHLKYAEINKKYLTVSYGWTDVCTDRWTDPKCRKTSFLKTRRSIFSI